MQIMLNNVCPDSCVQPKTLKIRLTCKKHGLPLMALILTNLYIYTYYFIDFFVDIYFFLFFSSVFHHPSCSTWLYTRIGHTLFNMICRNFLIIVYDI